MHPTAIGKRYHLVQILTPKAKAQSTASGEITPLTSLAAPPIQWWVALEFLDAEESYQGQQLTATATVLMKGDYRAELTEDCELIYEGKTYRIERLEKMPDGRPVETWAWCTVVRL